MDRRKLLLIAALVALVAAFFAFDLGRFFSLDFVRQRQADFAVLYAERPALLIGGFFVVYVAVTALSLPGAAIMTLAAGAIFGLVVGTVLVSFASSLNIAIVALNGGWSRLGCGPAPSSAPQSRVTRSR